MNTSYDHIIAGAGLAGLSLAYRLATDINYKGRLLLIDKDKKDKNDRTWSFWSKDQGIFNELIYHKWSSIQFSNFNFSKEFDLHPYSYNMIRGIDFYNYTLKKIGTSPKVDLVTDEIISVEERNSQVTIKTSNGTYSGSYLLKSYPDKFPETEKNFVWQHFKGWKIETEQAAFDPEQAVFMDFRIEQGRDTRFFYVLPTSKNTALIEVTYFSKNILKSEAYDHHLKAYIKDKLNLINYKILDEELGAIPMTTYNFQKAGTKRIIPIGTNGGSVKASSGYAFTRIQKHVADIHKAINSNALQNYKLGKNRFQFYDSILLNVILTGKAQGAQVFSSLFKKLKPQTIFQFLDEEGSFLNDIKIFTAPPTLPFLKAFFEELKRK